MKEWILKDDSSLATCKRAYIMDVGLVETFQIRSIYTPLQRIWMIPLLKMFGDGIIAQRDWKLAKLDASDNRLPEPYFDLDTLGGAITFVSRLPSTTSPERHSSRIPRQQSLVLVCSIFRTSTQNSSARLHCMVCEVWVPFRRARQLVFCESHSKRHAIHNLINNRYALSTMFDLDLPSRFDSRQELSRVVVCRTWVCMAWLLIWESCVLIVAGGVILCSLFSYAIGFILFYLM